MFNLTTETFNGTNVTDGTSLVSVGTILQCGILFSIVILTIIGNVIVLLAFTVEQRLTKVSTQGLH